MSTDNLFKEERKAQIMEILREERRAAVIELSRRFSVSEDTIRRDLRDLQNQGLIVKTHGGAIHRISSVPSYTLRLTQTSKCKGAIGRRAAEFVEDGESIIIDAGTTTLWLARALSVPHLRILTNSLEIARVIAERPQYELILLGGKYDHTHQELAGTGTVEQLLRYRVDKVFMGVTAIDRKNGITDVSEAHAALKQAMIRMSQGVVVLADHTKVGRVSFCFVAPVSEIDVLVTDDESDCGAFGDLDWQLVQVRGESEASGVNGSPGSESIACEES